MTLTPAALAAILVIVAIVIILVLFFLAQRQQRPVVPPLSSHQRSSATTRAVSRKTQETLLKLLNGDRTTAKRLMQNVKTRNPDKSESWCWEKVISDLERKSPLANLQTKLVVISNQFS